MQEDLLQQRFETVPLLTICILLACSELLLRRRSYALMHIKAGFKLLEERTAMMICASSSSSDRPGSKTLLSDEDELSLLFRTFDIHNSTYADRRTPSMPSSTFLWLPVTALTEDDSPQTIGLDLISSIHSCMCFTSSAGRYKYLVVSPEILIEQGRHLGVLKTWLTRLNLFVTKHPQMKPKWRTHLLILRNMCLSTIVFTSTILSPYETT
jgi:hypothetical protein